MAVRMFYLFFFFRLIFSHFQLNICTYILFYFVGDNVLFALNQTKWQKKKKGKETNCALISSSVALYFSLSIISCIFRFFFSFIWFHVKFNEFSQICATTSQMFGKREIKLKIIGIMNFNGLSITLKWNCIILVNDSAFLLSVFVVTLCSLHCSIYVIFM